MASKRETAQQGRAEARERRRNEPDESSDNGDAASDEQHLDGIKQAAKVAAASVALGAVAAAARALAERRQTADDEDDEQEAEPNESGDTDEAEPEPTDEAEPEPTDEAESEPEQQDEAPQQEEAPRQEREEHPGPEPPPRPPPEPRHEPVAGASPDEARSVADAAQEQLELLVGKQPETVSALERTDDGWLVTLEVLEVSRIPESTDVLASYEVELDDDRNLRRYARVRRYHRSQADQDGWS
jgi:flagellar biosynthesis/type III secretory pathway M-ring protein FliF/YscJ